MSTHNSLSPPALPAPTKRTLSQGLFLMLCQSMRRNKRYRANFWIKQSPNYRSARTKSFSHFHMGYMSHPHRLCQFIGNYFFKCRSTSSRIPSSLNLTHWLHFKTKKPLNTFTKSCPSSRIWMLTLWALKEYEFTLLNTHRIVKGISNIGTNQI